VLTADEARRIARNIAHHRRATGVLDLTRPSASTLREVIRGRRAAIVRQARIGVA
jgi:hypothetical protein